MHPAVMRAIIDEAHRLGLKAYVHAPSLRQAKDVLRAGADGLVHSVADAPIGDEFVALIKKNGATYTTTLSLYTAFSDVVAWMRRLASMDTGGRIPKDVDGLVLLRLMSRQQNPVASKRRRLRLSAS